MTVGRLVLGGGALDLRGSDKGAAQTVLGGSANNKALPWLVGGVVVIVLLIAVLMMDRK